MEDFKKIGIVVQIVFTFLFIWVYVSGLENVCISCQEMHIFLWPVYSFKYLLHFIHL